MPLCIPSLYWSALGPGSNRDLFPKLVCVSYINDNRKGNNSHNSQVDGTSHLPKKAIVLRAGHSFCPIHNQQRRPDDPGVVFQLEILNILSAPSCT